MTVCVATVQDGQVVMAPTLASSSYHNFPQAQTMADFPKACHDMLNWDELLTEKEKETKYKVRKFAVWLCPLHSSCNNVCCTLQITYVSCRQALPVHMQHLQHMSQCAIQQCTACKGIKQAHLGGFALHFGPMRLLIL